MSIEMELDAPPRASMTEDDLHRMMELNRIIKLSESITSGKHPRIKIPPHLAPSTTSTASPKLSPGAERRPGNSKHAHDTLTTPTAETGAGRVNGAGHEAHSIIAGNNLAAFVQNSRSLDGTDTTAPLSGLDFASGVRAVSPSNISLSEIPLQRARLEALLREPPNLRGKAKVEEVQADFLVDDVLRRGRELEKTFTPPPVAILSQGLITNLGGASAIPKANASSSAAAESADDQTFYSSNFSTPEFALTSRVPAESDRDDMPMEEGSDYEPELDYVPSSPQPAQQSDLAALQQVPPEQLATTFSELSGQLPAELLSTLLGANFDSP
ncbi:hypothetical protein SPBR_00829 [Sporothrix brasiliensis 5110]|uniref:Uncharacterized protein n=1 Tax=Sporothrix brasiliensis 5110 TaxID=1398154 RepID=A0A0C2FGI4_9PEZI|nr:uncharacterized protein SPBR_00829 [Sporothrix brasiliensis 5110]KIH90143.1 hypothetical protein SPBR_00829 [Sporothrix brasiliensis 5110]